MSDSERLKQIRQRMEDAKKRCELTGLGWLAPDMEWMLTRLEAQQFGIATVKGFDSDVGSVASCGTGARRMELSNPPAVWYINRACMELVRQANLDAVYGGRVYMEFNGVRLETGGEKTGNALVSEYWQAHPGGVDWTGKSVRVAKWSMNQKELVEKVIEAELVNARRDCYRCQGKGRALVMNGHLEVCSRCCGTGTAMDPAILTKPDAVPWRCCFGGCGEAPTHMFAGAFHCQKHYDHMERLTVESMTRQAPGAAECDASGKAEYERTKAGFGMQSADSVYCVCGNEYPRDDLAQRGQKYCVKCRDGADDDGCAPIYVSNNQP